LESVHEAGLLKAVLTFGMMFTSGVLSPWTATKNNNSIDSTAAINDKLQKNLIETITKE
jgi:hypothetical protein